jgi:hypothetical protein
MNTVGLQTVRKFLKLLNVSAFKTPEGVSNTKDYKQQYINVGSTY